eukprot:CAMPEP_0197036024 /NCGR_PEP_ID=MMETSP1384-20130603/13649_1 /TAXON_ID=29189 /ORGANISM="Ammonia sp." /LENGTH=728 /DNA_ID=CAMNT_0042466151 /DNA_START=60 /DNA_END=2246 /DNA_ORIENTATION=+
MALMLALSTFIYVAFGAVDYQSALRCNAHTPTCIYYDDGCNACRCSMPLGYQACTLRMCFAAGTPTCKECEAGSYWLAFDSFQPPGYPTCQQPLMGVPSYYELNSKCACPLSHPYYQRGVGCVTWDYCLYTLGWVVATEPSDIFTFPTLPQTSQCPYEYQVCTSDTNCNTGFVCKRPTSNYETCIPLIATLDDQCNVVAQTADCMGTGYGQCVPEADMGIPAPLCEVGGCSGQICAMDASQMASTCDYRCEYGCLQYQTCTTNSAGQCQWMTNTGEQTEYRNCLNLCNQGIVPPMLPPSAPIFEPPIIPQPPIVTKQPVVIDPPIFAPIPITLAQCEVGGCSSQLCAVGASRMVTTCEFRCEYGCLRYQSCGSDANGGCQWTTNPAQQTEYARCMASCVTSGLPIVLTAKAATVARWPSAQCEVGGCGGEICQVNAGANAPMICPLMYRCEWDCLQYQSCSTDQQGSCGWITNTGEEQQYQDCLDRCTPQIPEQPVIRERRQPVIVEAARPLPPRCTGGQCLNPITNECSYLAPCPNANYCYRPLPAQSLTNGQPQARLHCDAHPEAVCKFNGCGSCGEYFEIPSTGQILTLADCANTGSTGNAVNPPLEPPRPIVAAQPPAFPDRCETVLCAAPCDFGFGSGCNGCSAPNVECTVEQCAESPCCGCERYHINGRDVTDQCADPLVMCLCAPGGETYCCHGNEYDGECRATCGTCYDINLDCTLGPCA